ncbi:hypothetical protein ACA910_001968 [Epithemia clementina (nom. ined.)]
MEGQSQVAPVKLTPFCSIAFVNLDAFWSWASSTVEKNTGVIKRMIKHASTLEIQQVFADPGPLPCYDHCGYQVAVLMVLGSLEGGIYLENHVQRDTIRKFGLAYLNQVRPERNANRDPLLLADNEAKGYNQICADPCGSLWFHRFNKACKRRMGQDWRPDQAMSADLLFELLGSMQFTIVNQQGKADKMRWILATCYFVVCFVVALRGPEGMLLVLEGLRKHMNAKPDKIIVIVLWEQVNGEHQNHHHKLPSVNKTDSGIPV